MTLLVRGQSLEQSMSHYLIEQLRTKSNIDVRFRCEIHAVHGETHLAEVEIRNATSNAVSRHPCGGLFIFIGADAETGWLPQSIARDARGYVLTGDDVNKAGRWAHSRDPYLLETSAPGVSLPAATCASARSKRVASAVGEGSMAIAFVHQYLTNEGKAQVTLTRPRPPPARSRFQVAGEPLIRNPYQGRRNPFIDFIPPRMIDGGAETSFQHKRANEPSRRGTNT